MQTEPGADTEMTEQEPDAGYTTPFIDPSFTSPARLALAANLRRLGNGLVARQPDDEVLERINAEIEALLPAVESSPERPHAFHARGPKTFKFPSPGESSGVPGDAFPDCVVSGRANPMGINARLYRDGDEAVCNVTLGEAFEGAPGRAHGGIVAALVDETMGLVISMASTLAFTGRLTVTYRAPTPVGVPLEVRARLVEQVGRKITIQGELKTGDQLLAQSEGLFIAVEPGHFLGVEGGTATAASAAAQATPATE
jgi:acyl-coenzyme A thioesterase PaaI-like protein